MTSLRDSDKKQTNPSSSDNRTLALLPDKGLALLNSLLPGQASIEVDDDGDYSWEWRCAESDSYYNSPEDAFKNLIEYILESYEDVISDDGNDYD